VNGDHNRITVPGIIPHHLDTHDGRNRTIPPYAADRATGRGPTTQPGRAPYCRPAGGADPCGRPTLERIRGRGGATIPSRGGAATSGRARYGPPGHRSRREPHPEHGGGGPSEGRASIPPEDRPNYIVARMEAQSYCSRSPLLPRREDR
jgi:hypothetical protein